jgi:hypothetical protein
MNKDGDAKVLLKEAGDLALDLVIVLGIREEGGSVMLHNVDSDLDASFLLKTFVATLELSLLEEIYERTKRGLN